MANLMQGFSQNLSDTIDKIRSQHNVPSGLIEVGAAFEFGTRILIPNMKKLIQYHQLTIKMKFGVPEVLMTALLSGELDLAFCDDGPFLKKYHNLISFRSVFSEELILTCSSPFYQQNVRDDLSYDSLTSMPHVDYVSDLSVIGIWYQHHFRKVPQSLFLKLVSDNVQGVISAVSGGLGLGMIPRYLIEKELKAKQLIRIPGPKKDLVNKLVLAQLKDHVPTLGEKAVIQCLESRKRCT